MSNLPPPSTPIAEAVVMLHLNVDERVAVLSLVGVRTLGDLLTVLGRSEVEKELAVRIRKAIKE